MTAPNHDALRDALAKAVGSYMSASDRAYCYDRHCADAVLALPEVASLLNEIATLRENERKQLRRANDAEYMRNAYRQMLGPKGREVANGWDADGVKRVHTSWGPDAVNLDGEGVAAVHLQMREAAKGAVPIEDIDEGIEERSLAGIVATLTERTAS